MRAVRRCCVAAHAAPPDSVARHPRHRAGRAFPDTCVRAAGAAAGAPQRSLTSAAPAARAAGVPAHRLFALTAQRCARRQALLRGG